jgi:hypothetical protein
MVASLLGALASADVQRAQMEMQLEMMRYERMAMRNVTPIYRYGNRWHDALTNAQVEVPASRVPRENCRNCGAPTTSCGCDYCGTP